MSSTPVKEVYQLFKEGITLGIEGKLFRESMNTGTTYLDSHGQKLFFQPVYNYEDLERGWLENFSKQVDAKLQELIVNSQANSSFEAIINRLPVEKRRNVNIRNILLALKIIDGFNPPPVLGLQTSKNPHKILPQTSSQEIDNISNSVNIDRLREEFGPRTCYLNSSLLGANLDFLSYNGNFYALSQNGRNGVYPKLFHNNRYFEISKTEFLNSTQLREHETGLSDYLQSLMLKLGNISLPEFEGIESLIEDMLEGEAYFEPKRMGYSTYGNRTFVYFLVPSFYQFEKRNGNYYKFPEAKVAVELKAEGGFTLSQWVLNEYTHPALPSFDTPYQEICYGGSTDTEDDHKQIAGSDLESDKLGKVLLSRAIQVFVTGYHSMGVEYHKISDHENYYNKLLASPPADKNLIGNRILC